MDVCVCEKESCVCVCVCVKVCIHGCVCACVCANVLYVPTGYFSQGISGSFFQ